LYLFILFFIYHHEIEKYFLTFSLVPKVHI
jgi:hypothetical protein